MKNVLLSFVIGLVIGGLLMAWLGWQELPNRMLLVDKSSQEFDETVASIQTRAQKRGWKIPKVYDLQQSLAGVSDSTMTALKVISLCQPNHAYTLLREDSNKNMSALMPCRVSVYQTETGDVYITRLNAELLSKMYGGTVESVMGMVSEEQEEIIETLLQQ